jgi:hypothetical protein
MYGDTSNKGLPTDEAAVEKALAALEAKLVVYDQILGKQAYLAGDEISLADLFHLSWGALLKAGGSDIMESKPNVARLVFQNFAIIMISAHALCKGGGRISALDLPGSLLRVAFQRVLLSSIE